MSETCRLRRGEGYGACDDEAMRRRGETPGQERRSGKKPKAKEVKSYTKAFQKSKTGMESVLGSPHRATQLQRAVPPLQQQLQAKLSRYRSELSPLQQQAKGKVLKSHPKLRRARKASAVRNVSAAQIKSPQAKQIPQKTHLFATEKVVSGVAVQMDDGRQKKQSRLSPIGN